MSKILCERRESFATIRLNRPEKLNALTPQMLVALREILYELASDKQVRAVILTAAGDHAFCSGTDIGELAELDEPRAHQASRLGQEICDQIESCPAPVIAAINGDAAGGGLELVLACHLRIAARNARFSLPETKLALIPAYGGTQRLAREVGFGRALEIMLTGRSITADDACRLGLVNQVIDRRKLRAQAESLASQIAQLAPLAIRACLQAVVRGREMALDEGLALERKLFASLFSTHDMREGTQAFLEKRKPVFKGT